LISSILIYGRKSLTFADRKPVQRDIPGLRRVKGGWHGKDVMNSIPALLLAAACLIIIGFYAVAFVTALIG